MDAKTDLRVQDLADLLEDMRASDRVEVAVTRTIRSFAPAPADLIDGEQFEIVFVNVRAMQTWTVTRTHFGPI